MDASFKTRLFGGFDREDVVTYIEKTAAENQTQLETLRAEVETLRKQRDEAASENEALRGLTEEEIQKQGFADYFVDHTTGVYPQAASGAPFTAAYIGVKGDPITDLHEDLAAEQKARVTYDNILRLSDDPDVNDVIKFLRAREIVHFQRFGEGLRLAKDRMDQKNLYFVNPSFD